MEIVGETLLRCQAFADRRASRSRSRRSTRCSPIRRSPDSAQRSCAASWPTRGSSPPARPPRRCARVVRDGARRGQAALGTLLAAEIYGGTVMREGVQDRDDNETRFVWLARAPRGTRPIGRLPPLRAAAGRSGRPRSSSGAPGAEQSRLARALPGRVRAPRHQPDEDRVAPAARQPRAATCSSPTSAARPQETAVAEAIAGVRALCEQVRVLGSYPAARSREAGGTEPLAGSGRDRRAARATGSRRPATLRR